MCPHCLSPAGREQCKVLFPYEAQNEDELSIKEGEIVNIITKVTHAEAFASPGLEPFVWAD